MLAADGGGGIVVDQRRGPAGARAEVIEQRYDRGAGYPAVANVDVGGKQQCRLGLPERGHTEVRFELLGGFRQVDIAAAVFGKVVEDGRANIIAVWRYHVVAQAQRFNAAGIFYD